VRRDILSLTYERLAAFAQTWGMLYFLVVFVASMAYALWPSRQQQFDEAARAPFRED
jgi:cytochrome c oxidase cbb3-type subunit IV